MRCKLCNGLLAVLGYVAETEFFSCRRCKTEFSIRTCGEGAYATARGIEDRVCLAEYTEVREHERGE